MSGEDGFVVLEWRQGSAFPQLESFATVHTGRADAEEDAAEQRASTRTAGRHDRYAVAELVVIEEPR